MISVLRKKPVKVVLSAFLALSICLPTQMLKSSAAEARVDNPFVGATAYINPDYANLIDTSIAKVTDSELAAQMETVKSYPTAVWLDRIAAIHGGEQNGGRRSLEGHLDNVLAQKQGNTPITAMFVVYNLPGRDCHALASNGELPLTQAGFERYKTEYIDVLAEIFAKPKYQDIRIVTIVEPDGLPNLVTNLSDPQCAAANTSGLYVSSVQYALNKLGAIPNVYNYLDIGHSGWLGWDDNRSGAVQLYTNVVRGTTKGFASVAGFVTNTANTTPLEEPNLPNPNLTLNGQPIRSSDFYEWNPYFDEADFTAALYNDFTRAGWPASTGFLIDTSRNGWGGPERPTMATGSDINTHVNTGRVDRRAHRGLWCNNLGAGIGRAPQTAPIEYGAHLDALVWVKPPGESDGSSSAIPNNEGKGFDRMCDPTYMTPEGVLSGATPNAPVSGHWFHDQFVTLVKNAYPVIPASDNGGGPGPQVPAVPAELKAVAGDSQAVLSWAAVNGASSYTVKRSTTVGGPYTTVASGVAAASFTDEGLTNGTTYYYVVSAVNSAGASANSAPVSVTPSGGTTQPQVPAAPAGLKATPGDGKVALSWNAVEGADSYTVKRALAIGGPFTAVSSNVTAAAFTDTGLTNGTIYYYVVSAVNAAGESLNSEVVSAEPEGQTAPPPAGDLVLQYRASDTNAQDNQFKPHFNIKNNGTTAVAMSELTIRYWYTADTDASVSFNCDYARPGCSNITGKHVKLDSGSEHADAYLELSFSSAAGSIAAGSESGEIQTRNHASNWGNLDEANDYSFDAANTSFVDWDRVTLYQNGQLVWGIEP
ncbi:glycoside hydrolase family 6 protein [Paenibacillus tarimensis]|uniref:glycoside hydrolase family 6 protein n=1 Tax=Paenibacillus tarimensis TaxID=416012 RepID=UPI001F1E0598|nr:glycoside hydrolase family 6 protein [Paenibacillus tarimensis]MCF2944657.1 glycoside hydrolase family 6 protein [Paenibacillus tarimensis]